MIIAIDGDFVGIRVDQKPGGGGTLSVDADRAGSDQLVRCAPAGHAGSREEPIQAFLVRTLSLDGVLASSRGVGR